METAIKAKDEEMEMEKGWGQGEGNYATGILESIKGSSVGWVTQGRVDRKYACCRNEGI